MIPVTMSKHQLEATIQALTELRSALTRRAWGDLHRSVAQRESDHESFAVIDSALGICEDAQRSAEARRYAQLPLDDDAPSACTCEFEVFLPRTLESDLDEDR